MHPEQQSIVGTLGAADNAALLGFALQISSRIAGGVTHDLNSALQGVGDGLYAVAEDLKTIDAQRASTEARQRMRESLELTEAAYDRLAATARVVRHFVPTLAAAPTSADLGHELHEAVAVTSHMWRNRLDITVDVDAAVPRLSCVWWVVRIALLRTILVCVDAQRPRRCARGETLPQLRFTVTEMRGGVDVSATCEYPLIDGSSAPNLETDMVLTCCAGHLAGTVRGVESAAGSVGASFSFPALPAGVVARAAVA